MLNLITDPWIPVRTRDSGVVRIRPADLVDLGLKATDLASARPEFDGALAQFLIGLFQTFTPPRDDAEWQEVLESPPSVEEVHAALMQHANHFHLVPPEGPAFMQDFDPALGGEGGPDNVAGLLLQMPGNNTAKNNADLFVKVGTPMAVRPGTAAMMLLCLQVNAPAGGVGYRTGIRGGGPLTTLVWPASRPADDTPVTLFQRIWANVLPAQDQQQVRLPWCEPTRYSKRGESWSGGPAEWCFWATPRPIRFVAPTREGRCDLDADASDGPLIETYLTRNYGNNYPSERFRHPLSPYYRQKATDSTVLPMHPGKRGAITFQDWLALAAGAPTNDGVDATRFSAEVVVRASAGQRRIALTQAFGADVSLWAFGFVMDNAKALAWQSGTLPLMLGFADERREHMRRQARLYVDAAGQAFNALRSALLDAGSAADPGVLFEHTEKRFYELLRDEANSVNRREAWRADLRHTALQSFESAISASELDSDAGAASGLLHGIEKKAQAHDKLRRNLDSGLRKALSLETSTGRRSNRAPARTKRKEKAA